MEVKNPYRMEWLLLFPVLFLHHFIGWIIFFS